MKNQLLEYIAYMKHLQQNQTLLSNDFSNIEANMKLFTLFQENNYPQEIKELFHSLQFEFTETMKLVLDNKQNQQGIQKHKDMLNILKSEVYFSNQENQNYHSQDIKRNWQKIYSKIEELNQEASQSI